MITREQFQLQVDRLEDTFGERHFPDQRTHMIWDYVRNLEYPAVIRITDHFIRSSKHAPLPCDFQDAVRAEEKNSFNRDVTGAARAMDTQWEGGLKRFLVANYPGAKTLNDAVQIQIMKNQIARAKNEPEGAA